MRRKDKYLPRPWSVADAVEMYGIRDWGNHYFQISRDGHVHMTPPGQRGHTIDLKA